MPKRYYDEKLGAPFYQVEGVYKGRCRVYYLTGDPVSKSMARTQARMMERTAIVDNVEPVEVGPDYRILSK